MSSWITSLQKKWYFTTMQICSFFSDFWHNKQGIWTWTLQTTILLSKILHSFFVKKQTNNLVIYSGYEPNNQGFSGVPDYTDSHMFKRISKLFTKEPFGWHRALRFPACKRVHVASCRRLRVPLVPFNLVSSHLPSPHSFSCISWYWENRHEGVNEAGKQIGKRGKRHFSKD